MALPLDRFQNVHQVGGIQTVAMENGPGRGDRLALVNTGGGLRYTVSLDRGADLVDAHFNQHSLCYLTPNRVPNPSHAYHTAQEWLHAFPAGLMTTCGPQHIGHPREEDGLATSLHGHHSNQRAEVEMVVNPDPHAGQDEMLIQAIVRDSRFFGPNLEVRRTIQSVLGENRIRLFDTTTNRDSQTHNHAMMYHVNLGWPLLDKGAKLVLSGTVDPWPDAMQEVALPGTADGYKDILGPSKQYINASRGCIITPRADSNGKAHVGIINDKLPLAMELTFDVEQLPRVMIWQHFEPGAYVCGMEPLAGTPFGRDAEPDHALQLAGGASRKTELTITVHSDDKAIARFAKYDRVLKYP